MTRRPSPLSLVFALVLGTPALADVILVPCDRDTTLYESATGSLSNGRGQHCFTGVTVEHRLRRALMRFDVAALVPAGSTIQTATLELRVNRTVAPASAHALHRVTQDWGEANSIAPQQQGRGAAALVGDATWLHTFSPTTFWNTPGGDFDPVPSAQASLVAVGQYLFASARTAADAQAWLDNPASNFGWLIKGSDEGTPIVPTAKRIATRHAPGSARPTLRIEFIPPGSVGTNFCASNPNSSGQPAVIQACGSDAASPLNLTFEISPTPASSQGLVFFGTTALAGNPFGDGLRCTGGMLQRVLPPVPAANQATVTLNGAAGYAANITPGARLYFQFWFRDNPAGMAGFNTSDGLEILFQ